MASIYPDRQRLDERGRPTSYIGETMIDGRKRRVRAATIKDTKAKLARLEADHARGELAASGNMTVGQAIDQWLAAGMPRDRAPKTIENSEWAARLLRAELGTKRLAKLSVLDVERALRNIADGKQSRRTTNRPDGHPASRRLLVLVLATLRRVLTHAARRGLVTGTAAMAAQWAELPSGAPARVPRRALNLDQARRLWDALDDDRCGPMFRLQLLTGLRPGEAGALCWDALDLTADTPTLTVRRGLQLKNGRAVLVDELKTTASRRTIALRPEAVKLLRAQRKRITRMQVAAATWTDHDVVFPTPTGAPWNPSNARRELAKTITATNKAIRAAADKTGTLPGELPAITPNELRHSAASILSDRGVPHAQIADLLGHVSSTMVDSVYRHNVREVADAAVVGDLGSIARKR